MADDDDLSSLLADPAVWAEPTAQLEDRVVAAITRERLVSGSAARNAHPVLGRRRPGKRWRWIAVAGAAAAVVTAIGAVVSRDDGVAAPQLEVALTATGQASSAEGHATLSSTSSGWRIQLDATGLHRLDGGRFYQAWLLDPTGVAVSVGTFNEGELVTLWAGVSPLDYRELSITEEAADGNHASSGRRILIGTITD